MYYKDRWLLCKMVTAQTIGSLPRNYKGPTETFFFIYLSSTRFLNFFWSLIFISYRFFEFNWSWVNLVDSSKNAVCRHTIIYYYQNVVLIKYISRIITNNSNRTLEKRVRKNNQFRRHGPRKYGKHHLENHLRILLSAVFFRLHTSQYLVNINFGISIR